MQQGQQQFSQAQQSFIALMQGPKSQGLAFPDAVTAVTSLPSVDVNAELQGLVAKGVAFLQGNNTFALTRDATGNFSVSSGKPPAGTVPVPQAVVPVQTGTQPSMVPQGGPVFDASGDEGAADDALPWAAGDQLAVISEKLDTLIAIATRIASVLSPQAPMQAAPPPMQWPPQGPPMSAPMGNGYPQQAPPGALPPQQQWPQQPPAPPMQQQQPPWQQGGFQNAQGPYPPPNGQGQPPPGPPNGQYPQQGQPPQSFGYPIPGQPGGYPQR